MSVFRAGSTALITGGASGIGLAVAQLCVRHGMKVAVVDKNGETLGLAKTVLDSSDAEMFEADVSKGEEWGVLKGKVEERFGGVDLLMLNAGVAGKGSWGDAEYFEKILQTNLFGVVNGLNTYIPTFQSRTSASPPSAIIITGSKQGITNPPGNPAYNASKAAVKTLAEHLSFDFKDKSTSVHMLVPGWTFTGLSGNAPGSMSKKPDGAWSATQVADYMYEKIKEDKFYIICPDNDVTEETDKKRMLWSVGDIVNERPPLTRWRPEFKEQAEKWMAEVDVKKQ
ncbi:short chain dehydrogenase/reductase [Amniculicola lignicola CBS 123094]|uniref:Short chain dehydrogenase/reductase n=1 Tax=Amniculicola lignicola CBS 123094 TaxID=1392246 RepID=A0A6A5WEK2_9PLEO|nr:short chain dehydrogenase/reductase [Amniculicola lignicola CBS 123094]